MKVSVCMITYNQEEYIIKAIEGVLMQKTNFKLELILSNDASTDSTHKTIKNYILKHPKSYLIKYTNHKKNLGMMPNFILTLQQCKGKYIALCDGDDYWIDKNKLQKQVDFLDKNLSFNLVYTLKKDLFKDDKIQTNKIRPINKKIATVKDLVNDNFIAASSAMFRNIIRTTKFSRWFYNSAYGDWPLYLLLTKDGEKIKCLLDYTIVYRKNIGVLKKNKLATIKNTRKMFSNIFEDINYNSLKEEINHKLYIIDISFMKYFNEEKEYFKALKKLNELRKYKFNKDFVPKPLLKIYLKSVIKGFI